MIIVELLVGLLFVFLFAGGLRGFLHRMHALLGGLVFATCWPVFAVMAFFGLFDGAIILSLIFGFILKAFAIHIPIPSFAGGMTGLWHLIFW